MKIKDWKEFNDSLIKTQTPFTVEKSSMQVKFFTPYGNFEFYTVTENSIAANELFFIKKVKDHAESLNLKFTVDREAIKYIHLPRYRAGSIIENIVEIDLSAAYWNAAREAKIISEEIFLQGRDGYINSRGEHKKISKRTRLASLGALAKLTQHLTFDGQNWAINELVEAPKADYFFHIAEKTGEVMEKLRYLTGTSFLLYWVDAIFIKPEAAPLVEDWLFLSGIKFKTYNCEALQGHDKFLRIYSEQHKAEKETKNNYRDFYYKGEDKFDLLHKFHKKQKQKSDETKSKTE